MIQMKSGTLSSAPAEITLSYLHSLLAFRFVLHVPQLIVLNEIVHFSPVSTDVNHPQPVYSIFRDQWMEGCVAGTEDCLTQEIETVPSVMPRISLNNSAAYHL